MKFPSPSLTPPTLTTWQYSFNGYLFGSATASGILSVSGLGDNPDIRSSDPGKARDHGELVGLDLYGGRTFTVNLWSQAGTNTSVQTTLLQLAGALEVGLQTEQPMWFKVPNYPTLCVMCRPRKKTVPWDVTFGAAMIAKPVAMFHATSPYVYGPGKDATVGLPNPTSGMTFPALFPLTFGASTPNGVTVTNGGNSAVRPVLVISGPVTNPQISNASLTGNPSIKLTNPTQSGYTVQTGDQLVVDLTARTVLYYVGGVGSGTQPASRLSWVVSGSTWWSLRAGSNLVQLNSGDSVHVAGTCTVEWADTYIL